MLKSTQSSLIPEAQTKTSNELCHQHRGGDGWEGRSEWLVHEIAADETSNGNGDMGNNCVASLLNGLASNNFGPLGDWQQDIYIDIGGRAHIGGGEGEEFRARTSW